jgi:toxin ParE1/3/4
MSRYILSPQATIDLASIAEFYGDRSPVYADRLIGKLTKKFEFVGRFPKAGTPVDDLSPGLRKTPVEGHIVYFREAPTGAEIARVIHGARDVSADDFTE